MVAIQTIGIRAAGFSNIKCITLSTLQVHRLAVSMCSYGVSEVGTGACERVDTMMNGACLAMESTVDWPPVGVTGL